MQASRRYKGKPVGTTQRYQINLAFSEKDKPMLDYFVESADEREIPVATWMKANLGMCQELNQRGVSPESELRMLIMRATARVLDTQDGATQLMEILREKWPECWDKEDRISTQLT